MVVPWWVAFFDQVQKTTDKQACLKSLAGHDASRVPRRSSWKSNGGAVGTLWTAWAHCGQVMAQLQMHMIHNTTGTQ